MTTPLSASVPLTVSFAQVTAPEVSLALLRQLIPEDADREANRPFIEGDHWQSGDAWFGPAPQPGEATRDNILTLIERAFIFKNVFDELLDRYVAAVLGKEPRWRWVPQRPMKPDEEPTDTEQALIDEVEAAQTTWWDERFVHKALKSRLRHMLWARHAVLRFIVPAGTVPAQATLLAALRFIYLDEPDAKDAIVWDDPITRQRVGVTFFADNTGLEHAELTYVDAGGQTVIRIVPVDNVVTPSAVNNFSGALPMVQVSLDMPFITPALRSLQCALNMTLTLLGKGIVDSTFLERLITNALPPGSWKYATEADGITLKRDASGNPIREAFIPAKHVTGGRITSYIQGIDFQDPDGKTQVTTPGVTFRPTPSHASTIESAEFWYASMLGEARQDHVLIQRSATPSGKSREEARGDFIGSTKDGEAQAEYLVRTVLFTAVAMAEKFMGKVGRYTSLLKPQAKCRPAYGQLSVEERTQNIVEAEKGYRSDDSAMELNGIDDVDAERTVINAQPRATLQLSKEQAEAVDAWVGAGFTREVALHLIGLDDKEIKDIMKRESDAIASEPAPPAPVLPLTLPIAQDGSTPPPPPQPIKGNGKAAPPAAAGAAA